MIIMIGGVPCSGKSTLMRNLLSELGPSVDVEPLPLFSCQKHGDVLVVGRYPEGEKFGGTDRLSYGTISLFRELILQEICQGRKHIILEGDRFFRAKDIEWLLANYDAKVFILMVSEQEINRRHMARQDTQSEKWLKGRNTQISNILTNLVLMNEIQIRNNENEKDEQIIRKEIKSYI